MKFHEQMKTPIAFFSGPSIWLHYKRKAYYFDDVVWRMGIRQRKNVRHKMCLATSFNYVFSHITNIRTDSTGGQPMKL